MKRISNNETIVLSPVKMYWDDLQEVEERIKNGREVEIESGGYQYRDLNELKDKTKKTYINQVKISGRDRQKFNNSISIKIDPDKVWIHQDSESTETAAKVKDLLSKCSPWYLYSPISPVWHILFATLSWIPILLVILAYKNKNIYLILIILLVGIPTILWTLKYEPILGRSKIFVSLKKDEFNFWERNKDEILKGIVINSIVGMVGFLIGYFFSK